MAANEALELIARAKAHPRRKPVVSTDRVAVSTATVGRRSKVSRATAQSVSIASRLLAGTLANKRK
jgi:hypothetical protein